MYPNMQDSQGNSGVKKVVIVIIIVVVALAVGFLLFRQDVKKQEEESKPVVTNDLAAAPSASDLLRNLRATGLTPLSQEGTAFHIHQHLDITINGKAVPVPAEIGVGAGFISPIHTHDGKGILHVEAPEIKDFTLGQFFGQWGVVLNSNCVGTFCGDENNKLVVGVNGTAVEKPESIILKEHDEIHIWYGPKTEIPNLIKSYEFPKDL